METAISLDIFCRVIDNYGDAGVCLHLARSLSKLKLPHGQHFAVRLFCDQPEVMATLTDLSDTANPNLKLCTWEQPLVGYEPSSVVVSAFSCRFDEVTLKTLQQHQQRSGQPLIINLEYLSAEPWVEDCHQLPSPADGLTSHFFFPGFTPRTGGLNLDPDFIAQCQAKLGLVSPASATDTESASATDSAPTPAPYTLSLFGYDNPAVLRLLQGLAASGRECTLKVFAGLACDNLNQRLGLTLTVGDSYDYAPNVHCTVVPMTGHSGYDQTLLKCDFNLVRGEDSIVRAMHTGHPFLWQIYPQDESAHIVKLNAFLDCMERTLQAQDAAPGSEPCACSNLSTRMALLRRAMLSYNEALPQDQADPFLEPDFLPRFERECGPLFAAWARYLCAQPTLSQRLSAFILSKLAAS